MTAKADTSPTSTASPPANDHVCPWWAGHLLLFPLRSLLQNPDRVLGPHVRPGMTVFEPGCGMGFFTLPLARMVGPEGRVATVDLQEKMLRGLERRALRAGLADRIEAAVCEPRDLGVDHLRGRVDLVPAIHVIHEVPDPAGFLAQTFDLLLPGGRMLVLEPRGHVSDETFDANLALAREAGFRELDPPELRWDRTALLERPHDPATP